MFSSTCVTTLERVVAGPLDLRNHAENSYAGSLFDLGGRAKHSIEFLGGDRTGHAKQRTDDERRHEAGLVVRRGRRTRRMGIGQDAGIGPLDILLLTQFLETVQEAFVQGAVGLRLALQLLKFGFVLARRARNHRRLVDQLLEFVFLGLGGIKFGADRERYALRLGDEARTDRRQLVANLLDLRMGVTELRRELGALAGQLDVLDAQRRQRGVARHFRDVGQFARVEARLAESNQAAFALDAAPLGGRIPAVEIG